MDTENLLFLASIEEKLDETLKKIKEGGDNLKDFRRVEGMTHLSYKGQKNNLMNIKGKGKVKKLTLTLYSDATTIELIVDENILKLNGQKDADCSMYISPNKHIIILSNFRFDKSMIINATMDENRSDTINVSLLYKLEGG